MSVLCLGFERRAADDWKDLAVAPRAPRNYKDPAKIAEYIREATEKLEADAPFQPLLGVVTRVCVIGCGDDGEAMSRDAGEPTEERLKPLTEHFGDGDADETVVAFGIDISRALHQIAVRCTWANWVHLRATMPELVSPVLLDPAKMILPGWADNESRIVTLSAALKKCGEAQLDLHSAEGQAEFVRQLVVHFGLMR